LNVPAGQTKKDVEAGASTEVVKSKETRGTQINASSFKGGERIWREPKREIGAGNPRDQKGSTRRVQVGSLRIPISGAV